MASGRVVAEGSGPRGGVAGPPGGEAPSGDPDWGDLYEIGDHVDCNKGGWKPGRVVGKHRFAPKFPAWGYDVILDKGGECKEAVVIQLRPMMEGKCLRFHFPLIPIPPVLVSRPQPRSSVRPARLALPCLWRLLPLRRCCCCCCCCCCLRSRAGCSPCPLLRPAPSAQRSRSHWLAQFVPPPLTRRTFPPASPTPRSPWSTAP